MQPKVLLIGNDPHLLSSRGLVIQYSNLGTSTSTAFGLSALTEDACQDAAAAVLCHTLSFEEKCQAIQTIRRSSPRAMILNLHMLWEREELPEHASIDINIVEGPGQLLSVLRDLIHRWENHLP